MAKKIIYTKRCYDCDEKMEYRSIDFSQDEDGPVEIDLDFIGGKDFECPKCGKEYYMSDDIDWHIEG